MRVGLVEERQEVVSVQGTGDRLRLCKKASIAFIYLGVCAWAAGMAALLVGSGYNLSKRVSQGEPKAMTVASSCFEVGIGFCVIAGVLHLVVRRKTAVT